jgi:hypothetical protein
MVSSNTSRQSIEACSWAISSSDSGANNWGLLACLRWVLPNGFHIPSGTHFALDNVSITTVLAITSGIASKYRLELVSLTSGNNNRLWLFVNNTWAHLDNTSPGLQDSVQNAFNTGSNLIVEVWFDNTQTIVGLVVRSP